MIYLTGTIAVFAGLYAFIKKERQLALFCLIFGVVVLFIGYAASVPTSILDPRVSAEATNLKAEAGKFDAEAVNLEAQAEEHLANAEAITGGNDRADDWSGLGLFLFKAGVFGISLVVMLPVLLLLLIGGVIAYFVGLTRGGGSIIQE